MNPVSLIGHVVELMGVITGAPGPTDAAVGDFFRSRKYLGSHDRRFISEAVYGMIRHRRRTEALLSAFVRDNPAAADLDTAPSRNLSLYLFYSLKTMAGGDPAAGASGPPPVPEELWNRYHPGIDQKLLAEWYASHKDLGFIGGDDAQRLGTLYSFQDWMVREWLDALGGETEDLLASLNMPAGVTLRVNRRKTTREGCQERLRKEGLETEPTRLSPTGLMSVKRFNIGSSPAFKEGWFELQDEGSQLVSLIAGARPGDIVIDACAGAGGKSLHMAEMMQNNGEIVAIDTDRDRLRELDRRAQRAGVDIIRVHRKEEMQPENFFGKADLVLIDAPCSGTGTIRRNPSFKWSVTESLVGHYAGLQQEILSSSARFVRPGGRLVYATCSLMRHENEGVVGTFLDGHPKYRLCVPRELLAVLGIVPEGDYVKLLPYRHSTDGFFVAVMGRTA